MINPGDTLVNSVTGEELTFLQTSESTGGEYVEVVAVVQPGGAVAAAHVHPKQSETFTASRSRRGSRPGRAAQEREIRRLGLLRRTHSQLLVEAAPALLVDRERPARGCRARRAPPSTLGLRPRRTDRRRAPPRPGSRLERARPRPSAASVAMCRARQSLPRTRSCQRCVHVASDAGKNGSRDARVRRLVSSSARSHACSAMHRSASAVARNASSTSTSASSPRSSSTSPPRDVTLVGAAPAATMSDRARETTWRAGPSHCGGRWSGHRRSASSSRGSGLGRSSTSRAIVNAG